MQQTSILKFDGRRYSEAVIFCNEGHMVFSDYVCAKCDAVVDEPECFYVSAIQPNGVHTFCEECYQRNISKERIENKPSSHGTKIAKITQHFNIKCKRENLKKALEIFEALQSSDILHQWRMSL